MHQHQLTNEEVEKLFKDVEIKHNTKFPVVRKILSLK